MFTKPTALGRPIMLLLVRRPLAPDCGYWPGRRLWAALDAVLWPVVLGMLVADLPGRAGLVAPLAAIVLLLWSATRLHRALLANHRYRFTTWALTRLMALLLVVGWAVKLMLVIGPA